MIKTGTELRLFKNELAHDWRKKCAYSFKTPKDQRVGAKVRQFFAQ